MLARAARRLPAGWRLEHHDARELPFEDGRFDLVFAAYLLNVLSDEDAGEAAREARRVLAPGGRLVAVTPVAPRSFLGPCYARLWEAVRRRFPRLLDEIRLLDPEPLLWRAGFEPRARRYVALGWPSLCLLACPPSPPGAGGASRKERSPEGS